MTAEAAEARAPALHPTTQPCGLPLLTIDRPRCTYAGGRTLLNAVWKERLHVHRAHAMHAMVASTTSTLAPTLAQAQAAAPGPAATAAGGDQSAVVNLFETVVGLFSHGDALAQPDTLVTQLQALSVVWAIVFLIVGITCLFNGYKFYKIATVLLALLLGAFSGYWIGVHIDAPPFVIAACLGLLLGVMAMPLMKYAVALLGGLAGAFIGANLWAGLASTVNHSAEMNIPANAYWIGALIGLLVCGMLAFILFKLSIVMFTSVSGSTIAVLGGIALLLSFEPCRESVISGLTSNRFVVPLLVLVPAVIGLIIQQSWHQQPAKADGGGE